MLTILGRARGDAEPFLHYADRHLTKERQFTVQPQCVAWIVRVDDRLTRGMRDGAAAGREEMSADILGARAVMLSLASCTPAPFKVGRVNSIHATRSALLLKASSSTRQYERK